jgi:Family of unknown function (DUF6339)
MPYPTLNRAEARAYFVSKDKGEEVSLPATRTCDDGPEVDWDSVANELAAALRELAAKHSDQDGVLRGAEYEAEAGALVHGFLPDHPALADGDFWLWLVLIHAHDIVNLRYPGKGNPKNFGVGSASENLLYRLWLRGEVAYDSGEKDHYHLSRVGDVDFWRSHVFRQRYADVRTLCRALVRFQFPVTKNYKPRLKIDQIRALAKQLKRARSNLVFEVMTEERAGQFIESQWTELASQSK